jgi:aminoglycoside phosphotransferase (APT) family kinase protein
MGLSRHKEKHGWRRPNDIAPPDVADVERLLSPWLVGRRVTSVDVLPGGLMNRNCRVEIESAAAPGVLRIYDHDAAACAKELAIFNLVCEAVPVPTVLYANPEPEGETPPFALLEFIPGISLKALSLTGDTAATSDAAYEAGLLLARLAAYRFPATGPLTPKLTVDTSAFESPITTAGLVQQFATSATFQRRINASLRDRLIDVTRSGTESRGTEGTLVHGDFNARNVLVREVRGRWSVSAILDWEYAVSAASLCDIGHFLRYERIASPRLEPAFSRGCRDGGLPLDADWWQAARLADLPAVCELLTRESVPADVVPELIELLTATIERRDPHF